ncbi:hydroxylamine reductase, partial [Clostridium botulinum]|nr:hydroxylamine reductase [Clostridium botulinum]
MEENPMFCYQCEQTAGGKGCTKLGVCGKTPEVANLQDLLIYQCKGISVYAMELIEKGENIDKDIVKFVENSLFTTLTNVNFDAEVHVKMLKESQKIKEELRKKTGNNKDYPEQAIYNLSETKDEMLKDSKKAGIMFDQTIDADIRSLRQTIIYGLKGISAYGHQARFLGYYDDQVDNFYFRGLECTT